MACVVPPENGDSEMEEGEIVDDLSDISSGEEFLMRERLELLEMYNNVLERKKAKNPSFVPGMSKEDGIPTSKGSIFVCREVKYDNNYRPQHKPKKKKIVEAYGSTKVKEHKKKIHRKKKVEVKVISESSEESDDEYRNKRRKLADAVVYKAKHVDRSSLQDRLQRMLGNKHEQVHKTIIQNKELDLEVPAIPEYIHNPVTEVPMFQNKELDLEVLAKPENVHNPVIEVPMFQNKELHLEIPSKPENIHNPVTEVPKSPENIHDPVTEVPKSDMPKPTVEVNMESSKINEPTKSLNIRLLVDLCSDDDRGKDIFEIDETSQDSTVVIIDDTETQYKKVTSESDEDLELLRQHALKSKAVKTAIEQSNIQDTKLSTPQKPEQPGVETPNPESKKPTLSEDEDSDTAELRQICLKSAILKKAIEMKKKQKLRKRLSQSSIIQDHGSFDEYKELESRLQSDNNTDRESVDMDMGSDADDKTKDVSNDSNKVEVHINNEPKETTVNNAQKPILKEDELEEDEDLLRAKLLTSLSKNLPNLVNPNIIETIEKEEKVRESTPPVSKIKVPETRLVINVGESDSEGEHEATKNLTKMHAKLSEQVDLDFQQKLELLLKSKRTEVETRELPDVVQKLVPKPTEKYVPKTVNHLPRSEQMEYKYLVKRMAELQKIKEARQYSMDAVNQALGKDTLKPMNVSVNTFMSFNKLEEQIALSRKKLAEESSRMLQLREEATKLLQKYKIVSTELKNISTAINLNKKEQRNSQNRLSKIRLDHNRLSSLSKHSKLNGNLIKNSNTLPMNKLQKENLPAKEEYKNSEILKSVKVSVVNDRLGEAVTPPARLSVQVDVTNNKKTVIMPNVIERHNATEEEVYSKSEINCSKERHVEIQPETNNDESMKDSTANSSVVDRGQADENGVNLDKKFEKSIQPNLIQSTLNNEYESPLQALDSANWETDPNAIMCPFEVGGNCKDPDCKYFHPKLPSDIQ